MEVLYFPKPADLRKWFTKNHKKATEVFVGFYKKGTGKPSISWPESVDEALCFGWIDGVRKGIDEESYFIRFTPRRPGSIWSAVNIAKVESLTAQGLMLPEGLAAFEKRQDSKSRIYAFEQEEVILHPEFEKFFRSNKKAWAYFSAETTTYQRSVIWWITSAKQETTKHKRLEEVIRDSEAGHRIKRLSYDKKKSKK